MNTPSKKRELVILLVEDDPDDVLLTKEALEESEINCILEVVEDGEQALDYLYGRKEYANSAKSKPDLILLDLNMPRMDGREVLKKLKSDPDFRYIPVVVLTTSKQHSDIFEAYNLGSNSFITKPVKHDEFVNTMQLLGEYWFKMVELPVE